MAKKYKLFSDITKVSRGQAISLTADGLLNPDGSVISWARLAPFLRDRELSKVQAKCLVLVELGEPEPRRDLIVRLVSYISRTEKEKVMEGVDELLK